MLRRIVKESQDRSEEHQYLNLIQDILSKESLLKDGMELPRPYLEHLYLYLKDGTIPILTTKRVAWKTCLRELFWFIKGSTSNEELQIIMKIWNANASRDFLDSRGLTHLRENDLGPVMVINDVSTLIKTVILNIQVKV